MSWIDWDGFEVLSWQEQEHLHVIIVLIFLSVYTKPQMFDLVSSLSETYLVNLKGNSLLTLITSSVSTQTVYSTCLKILSDSTALYILFYCFTVWTTHIHCVILLSPSMNLLTLPPAEISHLIFSPGDIRDASSSKKIIFSCRLGWRTGLLYPPEHHAPAAPAGSARGGDPGGHEDGWQGAERLHPRLRAESQTHRAGREADGSRGWDNNHICSLKSGT